MRARRLPSVRPDPFLSSQEMKLTLPTRPVSGVHEGCISLSSPVASSRLGQTIFTGFAGLFATGDDWAQRWFFSDKEEVPGSSPGSPTPRPLGAWGLFRMCCGDAGQHFRPPGPGIMDTLGPVVPSTVVLRPIVENTPPPAATLTYVPVLLLGISNPPGPVAPAIRIENR
jgi:hypothetical protein